MSKWIDADALINDLEYDIAIDEDILAYVGTDQITRTTTRFDKDCKQNAIDLLIHAPSIDIVRCKECKHAHMTYGGDCKYCDMWKDDDDFCIELYLDGDFYCSYGERKESE